MGTKLLSPIPKAAYLTVLACLPLSTLALEVANLIRGFSEVNLRPCSWTSPFVCRGLELCVRVSRFGNRNVLVTSAALLHGDSCSGQEKPAAQNVSNCLRTVGVVTSYLGDGWAARGFLKERLCGQGIPVRVLQDRRLTGNFIHKHPYKTQKLYPKPKDRNSS